MIHSFTFDRDEQVFDLLEVLNDAYSLPHSLENLKERLERARDTIIENGIKKLEQAMADRFWKCRHGYEIDQRCFRCLIGYPWRWLESRRNA